MDNLFMYILIRDLIGMFISLIVIFITFIYCMIQIRKEEENKRNGHNKM